MSWFKGKRVLVPFDFSDACIDAVRMALRLAERPAEVHVVHVLLQLPATDPLVIWDACSDDRRKETARESVEKKLAEHDLKGVQVDVSLGQPGHVVADLAEEIDAGLIVIPSHGHTGLKRWFLGSVAEKVVQLAKCPVLVLKSQDEQER